MAATTVFNEAALPTCIRSCGVMYDVNGACAATALPNVAACFCGASRLAPFSTGVAGVCDGACQNAGDLTSIQQWYTSFCQNAPRDVVTTTDGTGSQQTNGGGGRQGTVNGESGNGGTWIQNHYQWVIFLVVMVVGIVGIWIGACIWRKRYLRKKDRQYALGRNLAHATESGRVVPNASQAGSIHVPSAGMFQAAPLSSAGVYGDHEKPKKQKKKWVVSERT